MSIGDVVEMNKVLQGQGIPAYVHLHDTCGSQFFTFGPPKGSDIQEVSEQSLEAAREKVGEFLSFKGIRAEFSEDGKSFWTV
ncbi:MAG: hypothetical protein LIV25_04795 [Olsenella sp.]|nr:hypothetical protein [Olsenella sp.]